MEKQILSLKNIYRLLTAEDYIINSRSVIGRLDRRGMTLSRFWQENLIYELQCGRCGRRIWRGGNGQNRYESELCNRSSRLPYYAEYVRELADAVKPELVLKQICQLQKSLQHMNYDRRILSQRLEAFARQCSQEDRYFREAQLKEYIQMTADGQISGDTDGKKAEFQQLWILAILLLHGLAGEAMNGGEMRSLRSRQELSFASLWELYGKVGGEEYSPVVFLTNRMNEICTAPLSPDHFFGREREQFELRQTVGGGGKYILSGMGGIGKTELLRQLLKCCEEEHLVDYICAVQYEGSVEESFSRAFSLSGKGGSAEGNFREALARIRRHAGAKVLVMVDNMNCSLQEDPALQELLELEATVLMTTRRAGLDGWTSYPVAVPTQHTAELIFRDHYGRALNQEERSFLGKICSEAGWRHTLVVRLMGRAARSRRWSLEQLMEQLQGSGSRLTWQEGESIVQLHQIYRQLYTINQFPRAWNGIIRLFALLPYRSYEKDFLQKYLVEEGQEELLGTILDTLSAAGWLEQDDGTYGMHPLVAECILTKKPSFREAEGLLKRCYYVVGKGWEPEQLWEDFDKQYCVLGTGDAEQQELADIMVAVGDKLSGSMESWHMDWMLAAIIVCMHECNKGRKSWERYIKKCRHMTECVEIIYHIHCTMIDQGSLEVIHRLYEQQQVHRTVGKTLYCALQMALAEQLVLKDRLDEAMSLLRQAAESDSDIIRIRYCEERIMIGYARADLADIAEWSEKALAHMHNKNLVYPRYEFIFQYYLCEASGSLGRTQKMESCLRRMWELLDQIPQLEREVMYNMSAGTYESSRGNYEEALSHLESAWRFSTEYFSPKSFMYATVTCHYAMMLNRAGKHDEAVERYREAIEVYDAPEGERHRIYNNMAVACLDGGKPQEAIEALELSYTIGQKLGGLAIAEPANNLARAYGMLGNEERELAYLREAAPLLEQGYGPDHPKTRAARERLSRLTAD